VPELGVVESTVIAALRSRWVPEMVAVARVHSRKAKLLTCLKVEGVAGLRALVFARQGAVMAEEASEASKEAAPAAGAGADTVVSSCPPPHIFLLAGLAVVPVGVIVADVTPAPARVAEVAGMSRLLAPVVDHVQSSQKLMGRGPTSTEQR